MPASIFQFDDFLLDSNEQRLQKNGQELPLPPKVFEVLKILLENGGQLVTYDTLMKSVWKDTFVEDGNLRYCVHSLRKVLANGYIETVPKRGYRFNGEVRSYTAEEYDRSDTKITSACSTPPVFPTTTLGFPTAKVVSVAGVLLLACVGFAAFTYFRDDPASLPKAKLRSVEIRPFEIIGDPTNEKNTVQEGLSNALVLKLRKIRGLEANIFVPDTEASAHVAIDADEILTGTYRVEGDRVRIDAQISNVEDNTTLATLNFTVNEKTQIDTENTIALRIARAVDLRVAQLRDAARIKDVPLDDETRDRYLTAQRILREHGFSRWQEAVDLMRKVEEQKPDWALAHAKYGEALVLTHGDFGCTEARKAAARALDIDSSLADAVLVNAVCDVLEWKWAAAEESFAKAIALDPELDRAYLEYGAMLDFQRRFSEAKFNLDKAFELRPFAPFYNTRMCQHYYFDLKPVEALQYCKRAGKIDPNFWLTRKLVFWVYVYEENWDEVRELDYGRLSEEEARNNPAASALADGDLEEYWKARLNGRLKSSEKRFSPVALATEYFKTGDKESALRYLEMAEDNPKYELYRVNPDPIFRPLWDEPRFIELMTRIGLRK